MFILICLNTLLAYHLNILFYYIFFLSYWRFTRIQHAFILHFLWFLLLRSINENANIFLRTIYVIDKVNIVLIVNQCWIISSMWTKLINSWNITQNYLVILDPFIISHFLIFLKWTVYQIMLFIMFFIVIFLYVILYLKKNTIMYEMSLC